MNVILFGSTGMIGAGTLIECVGHPRVERVRAVVRARPRTHLPFNATSMFRPGYIQPMKGVRSSTRRYQTVYDLEGRDINAAGDVA